MSRSCRAIVVDDNATILKVAARLLAGIPGVEVVGQAASGEAALVEVDLLRPDLVLMDLSMPGMGGLEATRRILDRPDPPSVIVMSSYDLPPYRDAALAAGATRFVIKSDLEVHLLEALRVLLDALDASGGTA